jgi:short-subunit dehydrogenase
MTRSFALVTGASSGIGLALANELASRGYDLAVCSAGERLKGAAEQLRAAGAEVLEVNADLGTREGVEKLWKEVTASGRDIDVACINAGVGVGGLFAETDLDKELAMVNFELRRDRAPREVCRAAHDGKEFGQNFVHRVDRRRDGGSA